MFRKLNETNIGNEVVLSLLKLEKTTTTQKQIGRINRFVK